MKKPRPLTILLLGIITLLLYSNWRMAKRPSASIPNSKFAVLKVKDGCVARSWANAVEVDCGKAAEIYYSQPIKQSPR